MAGRDPRRSMPGEPTTVRRCFRVESNGLALLEAGHVRGQPTACRAQKPRADRSGFTSGTGGPPNTRRPTDKTHHIHAIKQRKRIITSEDSERI